MAFQRVYGQSRIKEIFISSIKRDRLAHAYLFHGQAGIGKDAMAISLAMGFHCTKNVVGGCGECPACSNTLRLDHPHFSLILPLPTRPKRMKEENYHNLIRDHALRRIQNPYEELDYSSDFSTLPIISIDQIRSIKKEVRFKLAENQKRIFLISHADRLTHTASNSLLKILEEPPPGTILILTSSVPSRLMETILSRCWTIRFDPLSEQDVRTALGTLSDLPQEKISFFARLSGGNIQNALSLSQGDFETQRMLAFDFIQASLEGDTLGRLDHIEQLLQGKDKQGMQKILQLMNIWLRDLMVLSAGQSEKIYNFDQQSILEKFQKKWSGFNAVSAIRHVQQAIDFIEKNMYLVLIIHSLGIELKKCQIK
jgi:DNA polymerase-3 subunit delta'